MVAEGNGEGGSYNINPEIKCLCNNTVSPSLISLADGKSIFLHGIAEKSNRGESKLKEEIKKSTKRGKIMLRTYNIISTRQFQIIKHIKI